MSKSLSDINSTVDTSKKSSWKKFIAFLGPAYMISVGYMDPGNWATDIAGGSQFGYSLIWVLLMSNLIALLLQSFSARLGIVSGRDLAQASRETYPFGINIILYMLAEIAIAACDLAEVIGMAIGLNLLFHIPIIWGISISVLDTFLLLFLMNYGIRKLEAFIITLVAIIGLSFLVEMFFAKPVFVDVMKGFIPSMPNDTALYIAIGIIGATVMPHNLYLHSSLVQSRIFERTKKEITTAIKFNLIDSTIALNLAFFVNSAILILAASTFFKNGMFEIAEIQDAHKFLEPLLGNSLAPILFAIALIAAGQSSTVTGTLAGQIIMEGYLNLRIQPWVRRIITRVIAIAPAIIIILLFGEEKTGAMLILSQVILSLQLGFAIVPLIHFVSDKKRMGTFAIGKKTQIIGWLCAAIIIGLNVKLVLESLTNWQTTAGEYLWIVDFIAWPVFIFILAVLAYIIIQPFIHKKRIDITTPHGDVANLDLVIKMPYKRIAIAVDFSRTDNIAISSAIAQGKHDATYYLIHIVESVGAMVLGQDINDKETAVDREILNRYLKSLNDNGYNVEIRLGFGNPKKVIPKLAEEFNAELLVMGVHGHNTFMDLLLGTTVESVRHNTKIPLLIVR